MTHDPSKTEVGQIAGSLDCLTTQQLCLLGGITESTADSWRRRGKGPAYVIFGNAVLYPRKCVADYLQQNVRARREVGAAGLL